MKGNVTQIAQPLTLDVDHILTRHDPEHRMREYFAALMRENAVVNLVSRETTEADFMKLCAESLLPFETEPVAQRTFSTYLDIGAGGGMPAIAILLSGKITGKSVLYERTRKKALALERIIASLQISAHVLPLSFGEVKRPDQFSLITMRYVALTDKLLRDILGLLTRDGLFIYYGKPEVSSPTCEITVYPYQLLSDSVSRHFALIRAK